MFRACHTGIYPLHSNIQQLRLTCRRPENGASWLKAVDINVQMYFAGVLKNMQELCQRPALILAWQMIGSHLKFSSYGQSPKVVFQTTQSNSVICKAISYGYQHLERCSGCTSHFRSNLASETIASFKRPREARSYPRNWWSFRSLELISKVEFAHSLPSKIDNLMRLACSGCSPLQERHLTRPLKSDTHT